MLGTAKGLRAWHLEPVEHRNGVKFNRLNALDIMKYIDLAHDGFLPSCSTQSYSSLFGNDIH